MVMKYGEFILRKIKAVANWLCIPLESHNVDLDTEPFVPYGWSVVEHHKGGQVRMNLWRASYLELYYTNRQFVSGYDVLVDAGVARVANANLLDFFLDHSELIPMSWENGYEKGIYFFGTVYSNSWGRPTVRGMVFKDGTWSKCCGYLDRRWDGPDGSAIVVV